MGGAGYNNKIFVLDLIRGGFSTIDGLNVSCFTVFKDPTTGTENLFFGDSLTGKVYQQSAAYNFDGSAYESYWYSKVFAFDTMANDKFWYAARVTLSELSPGTTISVLIDGVTVSSITPLSTTSTVLGDFGSYAFGDYEFAGGVSEAGSSGYINIKIPISRIGNRAQIKIANSEINQSFRLHGLEWQWSPFVIV